MDYMDGALSSCGVYWWRWLFKIHGGHQCPSSACGVVELWRISVDRISMGALCALKGRDRELDRFLDGGGCHGRHLGRLDRFCSLQSEGSRAIWKVAWMRNCH